MKKAHGYLQQKNTEKIKTPILLFIFFFVTVLPQMLYIERGDTGEIALKAVFIMTFYFIVLIKLLNTRINIDNKELIVGFIFFGIQIIVNLMPSKYSSLTSRIMFDIAVSVSYYVFLESFFGRLKIDREDISLFAGLYQIFIIYACIVNFIINWSDLPSILISISGYAYNAKSFFSNRNTFALFLVVGAILTLYRLRIRGRNITDIIVLFFVLINMILTLSRTSLLGLTTFFIVTIIFRKKGRIFKGILKLIVVSGVIIGIIYTSGLADFFTNSVIRVDVGNYSRINIWERVWNLIISNNIITGVGFGLRSYITIHSTYLSIFALGGILLVLFYTRIFFRTIKICYYLIKKDYSMGIYFVGSLICFIVISFTETCIPFFSSAKSLIYTIIVFMIPKYYSNTILKNN